MQLVSKFNKGIRFWLCIFDVFSKYAWFIPLQDKRGITNTNAFQKILDESNHKPNKIWVDKGSKFYNTSLISWLEKSAIEVYSIHNEGKPIVAERFIRTLKVVSATFLPVYFVCLKESTCKTRKNVFYCTLKALFIFKIIKF